MDNTEESNYHRLDIILTATLRGMGKTGSDRALLNWYQGRAQGSIRLAEYLGMISEETSNLLYEAIDAWYDYYVEAAS